jgi:rSAM/selenodomain-associated transferase 1
MSAVLIMARAPRPGAVKTRLEPLLGGDGCARLQTELIRHTASWAASAAHRAWLAFAPADARAELSALVPADVELFPQAAGDLGARLRHATQLVFDAGGGSVTVIGTDAPLLGPGHVLAAETALAAGRDACIVPALDGGYALIALARPMPLAFQLPAEAWGGPQVLELTLRALHRHDRAIELLDAVGDLDTPADALELRDHVRCPLAVRAALHRHSLPV